jgi:tRNA G18 (ribose-2'-O)-methylase SpoU
LFVAEGEVVLRTLVRAGGASPVSLLIDAKRVDALADVVAALDADIPVYAAGQAVLDAIAGFHLHRGILALVRRPHDHDPDALLASAAGRAVVVMLFGIANHDNMGGVFRNAAAFGAHAVLLDADCCDPLYRKAIRVSVGATLVTPWARLARATDPIRLLERHGFTPLALSPAGAETLDALTPPSRAAILLGTEGEGLSQKLMDRARTVRIPMAGAMDSLNVAVTSGLVLHRLTR